MTKNIRFATQPTASDAFNIARRNAEITEAELADFMGTCHRHQLGVTTGRNVVTAGMWAAMNAIIAARTA